MEKQPEEPQEPKGPPSSEQPLQLYNGLGRPSATKFQLAPRRCLGMKVSVADVQRTIVGLQPERQFLAPAPEYDGKIYSLGLDEKWVADAVALPAVSSARRALVVQDAISRFLWAKPMAGQAAVVEPMREIMRVRRTTVSSQMPTRPSPRGPSAPP